MSLDEETTLMDDKRVPVTELTPLLLDAQAYTSRNPLMSPGCSSLISTHALGEDMDIKITAPILWAEACRIMTLAWPIMVGYVLLTSLSVASVLSLGHIGTKELAASALTTMFCNVTGFSLGIFEAIPSIPRNRQGCHVCDCVCRTTQYIPTMALVWSSYSIGIVGAPIATSISNIFICILTICYVAFVEGKESWGGWEWKEALDFPKLWTYTKLGVPGVAMVCSEWWAFELVALASGMLGEQSLAAQSIILIRVPSRIFLQCRFRLLLLHVLATAGVVRVVSEVMPLVALFQISDCLCSIGGGVLARLRPTAFSYIMYYAWLVVRTDWPLEASNAMKLCRHSCADTDALLDAEVLLEDETDGCAGTPLHIHSVQAQA
ncbi:hypothetical protein BASA83_010477 [Batrachochytrium salamandrivorans]|nr:hypothetical protein BASA83_010477 [Batrachochytrium salamandrivorans]